MQHYRRFSTFSSGKKWLGRANLLRVLLLLPFRYHPLASDGTPQWFLHLTNSSARDPALIATRLTRCTHISDSCILVLLATLFPFLASGYIANSFLSSLTARYRRLYTFAVPAAYLAWLARRDGTSVQLVLVGLEVISSGQYGLQLWVGGWW